MAEGSAPPQLYESVDFTDTKSKHKHSYKYIEPPAGVKKLAFPSIDYKGCILPELFYSPEKEAFQFDARDMVVCGYTKTGTTWLSEIMYQLTEKGDPNDPKRDVLTVRVPWWDDVGGGFRMLQEREPPRLMRTHMHYQAMPPSFHQVKPKTVCIFRNPKDTITSGYHFSKVLKFGDYPPKEPFADAFTRFATGKVAFGPFWEHNQSFWGQRNSGHVLCIFYENLIKDFEGQVQAIASFLDVPLSEAKLQQMKTECSIDAMRTNKSTNLEWEGVFDFSKSHFFRKGTVGDWKNLLNERQSQELDQIVEKGLKPLGLEFCYEL